jgi:RNA polymerase sigma-70 factor (ECF subfamily)
MEDDILAKAKNGDESAIKKIYKQNKDMIYNVGLKYLRDANEAEELVSITFEKFLTHLPEINGPYVSAWLNQTATNAAMDQLKHKSRISKYIDTDKDIQDLEDLTPDENLNGTPTEIYSLKRDQVELSKLIDKLPMNYKGIFKLYYLEGVSVEQISKRTGKSENSIKLILFKARIQMKEMASKSEWLTARYGSKGGKK